ncbi:MAG: DUF4382 domain-containing protein, partial [Gemmatimonadota bacterium]|nr:DUF4382 domain-containing protein [Gemmatimonadota bacterium]
MRQPRPFSSFPKVLGSIGLAGLLLLVGCESTSPQAGRVSVLLTDAPGDFKRAVVTISRVYLQSGDDNGDGGRVLLSANEVTTDLLTLANTTHTLVDGVVIPAGHYGQLRFVVTGGYVEVENVDGSTRIYASSPTYAGLPSGATVAGPLHMPSLAQSGLKVSLPGGVSIGGDAKTLLVDFDVAQSFGREAGNSGRWVMHPVVRATAVNYTGSILARVWKADGVTLPTVNGTAVTLAGFSAVLTNASGSQETLALADADGDGVFEARFRYLL